MRRIAPVMAAVSLCVLCCCGSPSATGATVATVAPDPTHLTVTTPGYWDWPSYGNNAQHTFVGHTTLTASTASTLKVAWFFHTGDAVTATPTVVDGTVYVGSWDTKFYALNLETGRLEWGFQLDQQHGVTPYPGEAVRDVETDGGLVTSSAWFQPGNGTTRPDLVIFGGGYTLYALDAHTGKLFWKHEYPGILPANPDYDDTRIFSSPVVVGGIVIFGTSSDGESGAHGELVGASLETGDPVWVDVTDAGRNGQPRNDGCGNVWSSGSVIPSSGLVVFDSADCNFSNDASWAEQVFAVHANSGAVAWRFMPGRRDKGCDLDFGASVNVGLDQSGNATFIGVGSKDGVYYSLNPTSGAQLWSRRVVFGGSAGGFIGTDAYDGSEIVGATALGDQAAGTPDACDKGNPADQFIENPGLHALDAANGRVLWQVSGTQSFGSTTIAGDFVFNGLALNKEVDVRLTSTGSLVARLILPVPNWGGIATVGDSIVFGIGSGPEGSPDGVMCFTPRGAAPVVP
jgi:outer membrane protein assembly factor BamB